MIFRIDVSTVGPDRLGESIRRQIAELGIDNVGPIATRRIFLVDAPDASPDLIHRAAAQLLADPIVERATVTTAQPPVNGRGRSLIEIHLKPGVMDPVAASTEMALRDMRVPAREVRTGRAFVIDAELSRQQLERIATRVLANGVIESVHFEPHAPGTFSRGREKPFELRHISLGDLADDELARLSREGHLFLSLTEMKAIQSYYRQQNREPTDVELETIAQTWSEHCVHKTLKSAVEVHDDAGKLLRKYGNLIKETIFASTQRLAREFCVSVFKDNAGVIAFDETDAVCFKVETHNHPSAIEPYGGSATGVGGVIRDVLGTGLAARPIANTDVFCVAFPEQQKLPRGVIHPKRVLQQVVAGVRDYGNRMGIPTVNGAVYFDDRYIGNPLVFCGCVGLLPRDKIEKAARSGDAIVLMGGRTGRDGIHGATFSSAELTDTHADEFSHAVQIGNAITEKKLADVILQARDANLFTAITDCGAGGLSSAVGEMGEKVGAAVHLDRVPLKYAGLRYDEIWISEAQERMVLSVPPDRVDALLGLAASEDVEATVIGYFGADDHFERGAKPMLYLHHHDQQVGELSMQFLHDGIPMPTRKAIVSRGTAYQPVSGGPEHGQVARATHYFKARLLQLLSHPNIASKHWIIRQYDHEVQGGSVIKPLVGPHQIGPSDAAVVRPKLDSFKGVAIACGLAPHIDDPYDMTIASIDEAIRNVVCVGADPDHMALLDNFCWPSVADERTMGTLVTACEACRDGALAYGIPFISGKDSLHNQFTNSETGEVIRIPRTLLISAIGVIDDVRRCVSMDLKGRTNRIVLVAARDPRDINMLSRTHRLVASTIRQRRVLGAHDLSDGGLFVAAAEMCIASGKGLIVSDELFMTDDAFVERPGRYLLELDDPAAADELRSTFNGIAEVVDVGLVQHLRKLTVTSKKERVLEIGLEELAQAWRGTLDW